LVHGPIPPPLSHDDVQSICREILVHAQRRYVIWIFYYIRKKREGITKSRSVSKAGEYASELALACCGQSINSSSLTIPDADMLRWANTVVWKSDDWQAVQILARRTACIGCWKPNATLKVGSAGEESHRALANQLGNQFSHAIPHF
jgi:hypothetical protein